MPTLHWIGKDKVINHHLDVPFRVLDHQYTYSSGLGFVGLNDEQDFEKKNKKSQLGFTGLNDEQDSVEKSEIPKSLNPKNPNSDNNSGNKIIHGDNLEALKALLPEYENKIKCIYIDPPYNTGNEGWVYNDNVSDPKFKKWLGQIVGKDGEDLTRHDKWLCMMYPRIKLLQKLMAQDGLIFMSLDDNELENGIYLLNDIFGKSNKLACAPWLAEPSGGKEKRYLRNGHEYILIYHNGSAASITQEERSAGTLNLKDKNGTYKKGRELRKWGGDSLREDRPGQWYPLKTPTGEVVFPYRNDGKEGHWRWGELQKMKSIIENPKMAHWELCKYDSGVEVNGETERWVPFEKIRDSKKMVGWTTWLNSVGYNSDGTASLKEIFGTKLFDTPKPVSLIEWLISLHNDDDGIILDSFAGSGTTAHAVLNLNKADGGNRKFILIEMEDYADSITAERVKRVINGYGDKEGTGGSFDFYELGPALFLEDGNLNEAVGIERIREYIWYSETKKPMSEFVLSGLTDKQEIEEQNEIQKSPNQTNPNTFLGIENDTAFYFYYAPDEITSLDHEFLASIKTKAEQYVIYADNCLLTKAFMAKYHIIFKKIPRDITRF